MRPLACLLALGGCNWIYGLTSTIEIDAIPPDAEPRMATLAFQVAVVDTDGSNAEMQPVFAPVTPDPKPGFARLDERTTTPLVYMGQTMTYPYELLETRWRLEYSSPLDGLQEIQWKPADTEGHLVVPIFGQLDRGAKAPASTGYTLNLGATTFSNRAVIYTTGYWTATPVPVATMSPAVDFGTTKPLSGEFGRPGAKDTVAVIDYTMMPTCTVASRVGSVGAPPLVDGSMQAVALANDGGSRTADLSFAQDVLLVLQGRLSTSLASRSTSVYSSRAILGRVPHPRMPAFTTMFERVPAPVMIPLAICDGLNSQTTPVFFDAGNRLQFPMLMYGFVGNERITGSGVTLRSSLAGTGTATMLNTYDVDPAVQIAIDPKLDQINLDTIADRTPITAAAKTLTFELEPQAVANVDYYEVILYHLAPPNLVPIRVYVGPDAKERSIRFDPTVMVPGNEYVFAIRTYAGRPQAESNDFRSVALEQSVATVFTRTFTL